MDTATMRDNFDNFDWNGMIIASPDLDGLVAASILCEHYPEARLVGFYDPNRQGHGEVYATNGVGVNDLQKAVWVDLDIMDARYLSIGQHMIHALSSPGPRYSIGSTAYTQHEFSMNPHHIIELGWDHELSVSQRCGSRLQGTRRRCRKIAYDFNACTLHGGTIRASDFVRGFRRKYPFSCSHFMLEIFGSPDSWSESQTFVLNLCDSTLATALKYRDNAYQWQQHMHRDCNFLSLLSQDDPSILFSGDYLRNQVHMLQSIVRSGLFESQIDVNSEIETISSIVGGRNLSKLAESRITSLNLQDLCSIFTKITGMRLVGEGIPQLIMRGTSIGIAGSELERDFRDYSNWLNENRVFSIAFTYSDRLQYTTGMELVHSMR